jgi:hypothetical protein
MPDLADPIRRRRRVRRRSAATRLGCAHLLRLEHRMSPEREQPGDTASTRRYRHELVFRYGDARLGNDRQCVGQVSRPADGSGTVFCPAAGRSIPLTSEAQLASYRCARRHLPTLHTYGCPSTTRPGASLDASGCVVLPRVPCPVLLLCVYDRASQDRRSACRIDIREAPPPPVSTHCTAPQSARHDAASTDPSSCECSRQLRVHCIARKTGIHAYRASGHRPRPTSVSVARFSRLASRRVYISSR